MLLIGGTSGSGKSTVASELMQRLGVVREEIISTDSLREEMRHSYPKEHLIWRSTYNVTNVIYDGTESTREMVVGGLKAQVDTMKEELLRKIEKGFTHPLIVEGVHITPELASHLCHVYPKRVVPVFLLISDASEHKNRFAKRPPKSYASVDPIPSSTCDAASTPPIEPILPTIPNGDMNEHGNQLVLISQELLLHPTTPINKYLHFFQNITCLSEYLEEEALQQGCTVIDNIDLESTLAAIYRNIMVVLRKQQEEVPVDT